MCIRDRNKLAKNVGIIDDSSDVYSSGIEEKFEAEAKDKGLQIVSKAAFTCLLYTSRCV